MPEEQAPVTARKFITWADLREQMLDDLASGAWRALASYSLSGRAFTYCTLKDFRELLAFVEAEMAKETGIRQFRRRTYARQGGGGDDRTTPVLHPHRRGQGHRVRRRWRDPPA